MDEQPGTLRPLHQAIGSRQASRGAALPNGITHAHCQEVIVPASNIQLQVKGENDTFSFAYSLNGTTFQSIGQMDTRYLSTETAGGFTGIILGLYATSQTPATHAYADFDWFEYLSR